VSKQDTSPVSCRCDSCMRHCRDMAILSPEMNPMPSHELLAAFSAEHNSVAFGRAMYFSCHSHAKVISNLEYSSMRKPDPSIWAFSTVNSFCPILFYHTALLPILHAPQCPWVPDVFAAGLFYQLTTCTVREVVSFRLAANASSRPQSSAQHLLSCRCH